MARYPLDAAGESPLAARLRSISGNLTKAEAVIAQWLVLNEATLGPETGASVAAKTGVSEIAVSRFLRRAGFRGLAGLKEELQAALVNAHLSPSDRYFQLLDGEIGAILKRVPMQCWPLRPRWKSPFGPGRSMRLRGLTRCS